MSQILLKQRHLTHTKIQPQYLIPSNAQQLVCHVCSKGLEEGYPVTAKSLNSKNVFLCDVHYPLV